MPVDWIAAMRGWGLVKPEELERIAVVSPHLDDAVLGCGRLLSRHPGAAVVTVFTGTPSAYPDPMTRWDTLAGFAPGDDVLLARKREDERALGSLGARPVWLDFVEHQYLERPEWVGGKQIVDSLDVALCDLDPTAVFVPFGLANPDHVATHRAARLVRERHPEWAWFCYEDSGYKHIPGMLAGRIARLFRSRIWPTPVAPPIDHGEERKLAAFAHYGSQVLALESDWQITRKLAAPAAEQYWRLEAPPPAVEEWFAQEERAAESD
jgi:LmbE family N-acetylglucosaminyl deacetylase